VAIIPYAQARIRTDDNRIAMPLGQTVKLRSHSDVESVYRTEGITRTMLTVKVDRRGQLLSYEHASLEHAFKILFDPALPTAVGGRSHYSMSFDQFEGLIQGVATVTTAGAAFSVEWNHETPEWARDYCFTSKVRNIAPAGYDFVVAPKQR
jgi:hypothetical protein